MRILISPEQETKVTNVVRTDPTADTRSNRAVAAVVAIGILILGITAAFGASVPEPDESVACCLGPEEGHEWIMT